MISALLLISKVLGVANGTGYLREAWRKKITRTEVKIRGNLSNEVAVVIGIITFCKTSIFTLV